MVKLKKMEKKIIENDVKTDEFTIKIEDRSELLKKKIHTDSGENE